LYVVPVFYVLLDRLRAREHHDVSAMVPPEQARAAEAQ
jgi:hypothetical protein